MAPAKSSRSVKAKKPAPNTFKPTKISKRSQSRTKVATMEPTNARNLNRPKPPQGRTYPVTLLKNGLVSMERTPDYLLEAAQRNARNSPLLRLPAEIRNMIFRYAVGGNEIHVQRAFVYRTSKKWRDNSNSYWHGRATHLGDRRLKALAQGTAFHLPEVCRQIYAETATLSYATNTFILPSSQGRDQRFSNNGPRGT
ncbi:uncharacterized protein ALTATR162_LOCUS7626 [Alternaria atra]|uniref:DUF7730 domain-containing protein n=1 Tax=Alternaria atra TaxID=119953 RepID=A0A8J2N885_9PLEO|nr:uncharacterized protein ALTATR162_LOCUS7626 [Alternaria atra]CAG5173409.1 unnamed protein product [Alternaria atra]